MAFNGEKTREWKSGNTPATGTPALGSLFNDEFDRLYGNDNYLKEEADKLGGASLDTATDLGGAGSSDSKISSQKAVKTYIDDKPILDAELIASDITLEASKRYKISGNRLLSLPASVMEGQRIEIFSEDASRIIQSDSEHSISYLNKYFTKKGLNGYIQIPPKSRILMTYNGNGLSRIEPGVKLSDPSILPPGSVYCCEFSYDGIYLAVGHDSSPYLTIYKRSGDVFTKLSNPETLPPDVVRGVSFSRNGKYLACAHSTLPYITIYEILSNDTFTKISNPSSLPSNESKECCFSSDCKYFAVAHESSPYITVYEILGSTFQKLSDPSPLPTGTANGCSFSYDGNYLAVAHIGSPYVTIYYREGGFWVKLPNPNILPTGNGKNSVFSYDGKYLVVGNVSGSTDNIRIYRIIGDSFIKTANPDMFPWSAGIGPSGVDFSYNGRYLSVSFPNSPYIAVYRITGDSFGKISNPSILPTNNGRSCAFSHDSVYLAVGHDSSPYLTIYKNGESITKQWLVEDFNTLYGNKDLRYSFV